MIDADTLVIIAGAPVYGLVIVVLAKMSLNMFMSQNDLQTTETASNPVGK
jgi:hypothetical protein